jgi:hypothetical protein
MTIIAPAPVDAPVKAVKPVNLTNKPEARYAIEKLRAARKAKSQADKDIKAASAVLDAVMGNANEAIIMGQTVLTRSSQRSRRDCDFDTLLAINPEAYALTVKKSYFDFWETAK